MLGYICLNNVDKKILFSNFKVLKLENKQRVIYVNINDKYTDKKKKKVASKLIKILNKNDVTSTIFEEEILNKYKYIYNEVLNNDFKIVNGNYLYERMLNKIIDYILEHAKNINLEQLNVGLIINILSYNRLEYIKELSNKVKGITILTNTVSKFSNLANEIMENTGLSLKVTNNIKSGIKNCNLIINFDFDLEKSIDCNFSNCIVINFNNKVNKIKRNFKGIIINDINVNIEENEIFKYIDLKKFRNIALLQSIDEENINEKINYLVGIKEKIDIKELENFNIGKKENKKRK